MEILNIVVCVKQILNQNYAKEKNEFDFMISTYDQQALEVAISLKERCGGSVTAICMGPEDGREILNLALLMGADDAVLLTDKSLVSSDSYVTSYALSKIIEKIGNVDLVLCGKKSADGDTAQVGPQIAADLDMPHVSCVIKIAEVGKEYIVLESLSENGIDVVRVKYPCLLCIEKNIMAPHPIHLKNFNTFQEKSVQKWNIEDVGMQKEEVGQKGSKTRVYKAYEPEYRKKCEFINGDNIEECVEYLLRQVYSIKET